MADSGYKKKYTTVLQLSKLSQIPCKFEQLIPNCASETFLHIRTLYVLRGTIKTLEAEEQAKI